MNRAFKFTIAIGWIVLLSLGFLLLTISRKSITEPDKTLSLFSNKRDVVNFWAGVLVGSPEERVLNEVIDEYNRTHSDVYVHAVLVPYAAYLGKVNISIASGQPPDVCWNSNALLQAVKVRTKIPDLAIPIPDDMLTPESRKYYGEATLASLSHEGKVYAFPNCKYLYGASFLANAKYFEKAGIDVMYYMRNGWDYPTFRAAMKKVRDVMQKEKGEDSYPIGINLRNMDSMFYDNLLLQSLGRECFVRNYLYYDNSRKRYVLDPLLTPEMFERPLQLIHDMIYVDHTWGKTFLGLEYSQILANLETNDKLAATLSVSLGIAVSEQMTYNMDYERGVHKHPVKMVILPIPTPTQSMPRVYCISAVGYGVLRQIPYKGDKHTRNSLNFAKYLTEPKVLAKFFAASHRRFMPWPDEESVRAVLGRENDPIVKDPWLRDQWDYYTKCFGMKDNLAVLDTGKPVPDKKVADVISNEIFNYLRNGEGHRILEDIVYNNRTPKQAAKDIFAGLTTTINAHY